MPFGKKSHWSQLGDVAWRQATAASLNSSLSRSARRRSLAESEWDGRVRMEWPSPNGMAESSRSSSRIDWPIHRGQVWIGWSTQTGRIRMSWPNPNHPGRVRISWPSRHGRIRVVWPSLHGRVRVVWPSRHGRVRVVWPNPNELSLNRMAE